jgi:hypothetical protein
VNTKYALDTDDSASLYESRGTVSEHGSLWKTEPIHTWNHAWGRCYELFSEVCNIPKSIFCAPTVYYSSRRLFDDRAGHICLRLVVGF